jgi:SAM-dependent methyltransferase
MNYSIENLYNVYLNTISEYNLSPLAVDGGYIGEPTKDKFDELVECVNGLNKDSIFLDVGTGMGIAPRFINNLGIITYTLDNPYSGGDGLQNASLAGIKCLQCDILSDSIPLPDNSVDCILFADVIEHLVHSPKFALIEFMRILKPGGIVVATTPNALRISVRIKALLGYSNWPYIGDYFEHIYHGGHHHEYTVDEFSYVFQQTGFRIEKFILSGTVTSVKIDLLSKIQSRSRAGKLSVAKTHPLITLGKLPIFILEQLFKSLRPQMLLVARKS